MPTHLPRMPRTTSTVLLAVLFAFAGCGDDATAPPDPGPGVNLELNEWFEALPDWSQPAPAADYALTTEAKKNFFNLDDPIPDWQCDSQERRLVVSSNRVFAPETDFGVIWPGAVLSGTSVRQGDPRGIAVDRAPLTIYTDLTVTPNFVVVENPSAASVNDAVAQLVGPAGNSYKSRWTFVAEEILTNKHSQLSLGMNAGYAGAASGSLNFSESRTMHKKVFAGRAVEEMFTIRFADDQMKTPAEFFGPGVTAAELEGAGLGSEDLPVYIRSITYGRMVVFTAVVTGDASNQGFGASLTAWLEGAEVGGGGTASDHQLLQEASFHAHGFGPDAGEALAALQNVELNRFFAPAEADQAVPLFFEIVTVKDLETEANLGDSTIYETMNNPVPASGYDITLTLKRIRSTNGPLEWERNFMVEVWAGTPPWPRGNVKSGLTTLNGNGAWKNVNDTKTWSMGTWTTGKIHLDATELLALLAQPWDADYPYRALPRGETLNWKPVVAVRDGALRLGDERRIEFDVDMTLIPTFD